jgi:hypothetical protein
MENTKIPTTVNNGHRQLSPPPLPARKSILAPRRKTLVSQTLTNSNASRAQSAVSKSIELSQPNSNKIVAEVIDASSSAIVEIEQSSNLQVQDTGLDINKFFDAEDSFVPRQDADEQIIPAQNMSNASSEKQVKRATQEIGTITEEEVNFAAFTLSDLIKASKRIHNKRIRKELDNRCRGKSLGLLSNTQHVELCKYFVEFKSKTLKQLTLKREELEEHIQEEISYDPFNVENVSEAILLQMAAVNLSILADPTESSG